MFSADDYSLLCTFIGTDDYFAFPYYDVEERECDPRRGGDSPVTIDVAASKEFPFTRDLRRSKGWRESRAGLLKQLTIPSLSGACLLLEA
jgi:hypothetical protein